MTGKKEASPKRIYNETYVKGTYVPSKEDLIGLIEKNEVTVYISERSQYSDGGEEMKIVIKHK